MAAKKNNPLSIFATNKTHASFCEAAVDSLSASVRKRITLKYGTSWRTTPFKAGAEGRRVLVVSRLSDFGINDPAPAIGRLSQYLMFTEMLPPESICERVPRLRIRAGDIHRLHIARESDKSDQLSLVKRLITGVANPGQGPILDAWWEFDHDNALVVISPDYFRLRIPLEKLVRFIGSEKSKIIDFQIDDDGEFIHWPHCDVHFGWDELEALIDPAKSAGAKTRNREFSVRYGCAIRAFRELNRLSQSQITGIDPRHVRRIENGELALSPKAISLLARAHHLDPERYLAELSKFIP